MRRLLTLVAAAVVLASCGDSNNDSGAPAAAPPPKGVTGTLAGQQFTAADATAIVLSQARCALDGVNASATGLVLGFSTFPGLCTFAIQNQLCARKQNAATVTVLIVRANVAATAAPVQPGTYTVSAASPNPDAQGQVIVTLASGSRTDAVCATPAGELDAVSGTVRIDSVTPRVTGNVDLVFPDGGHVSGPFSTAPCAFPQTDVCTAAQELSCPAQRACLP